MNNSSVLLIYTGGTIGMTQDNADGSLKPFDFKHIIEQMPDLRQFDCKIDTIEFSPIIDSSDADAVFWAKLVNIIKDNYAVYDGFVILHGTDTMAYTASALSFMLENLTKPVILTGSQLPIGMLRTDGKENLITSIEIAHAKINGKIAVPEVCIYFQTKLYRGNRTVKFNTEHFDAFKSPNYPALAEAGIHLKFNTKSIHYPIHHKLLKVYDKIDNNVAVLKIFPNISKKIVESVLSIDGLRGVVLETYGSGNAPTSKWFLQCIEKAVDKNIAIVNITQCSTGSVEMGRYATSTELKRLGVLDGGDMTTEAAVTKLMFLLGQKLSPDEIKLYVEKSIAGERS